MPSLHLSDFDAGISWQTRGHAGPVAVWLPGPGMPARGNFGAVLDDPALPPLRSVLIDPLGAGASGAPGVPPETIAAHARRIAAELA